MVKKEELKRFGKAVEATLNGAVQDVVADFDTKPTEELRVDFISDGEFCAVLFGEASHHFIALGGGELSCAFNDHCATSFFKTHEALEGSQDSAEVAGLRGDEFGNQIP